MWAGMTTTKMKKLIRSYTSFTRLERIGLLALGGLLVLLLFLRATMHYWVHPVIDTEKEQKLVAAWETYKRAHPAVKADTSTVKKEHQDAYDENETPLPDSININNADSATLVRLKGIGPVTAGKIISRRATKGPVTDISQLSEVGAISGANLELLRRHLVFDSPKK